MAPTLRKRLVEAESKFLIAVNGDTSQFASFDQEWSAILHDLECAVLSGDIDDDTLELGQATASVIRVLAESFLQIHTTSDTIAIELQADVEGAMAQMSLNATPELDDSSRRTCVRDTPCRTSQPPYIAPAYSWLCKHLHNPYPDAQTRSGLAKAANTTVKRVNAWFSSTRQRIGWTDILHKHFDKSRSKAVAAAKQYISPDGCSSAANCGPLAYEFARVQARADALYADWFQPSVLAGEFDVALKDMTEEDRVLYAERRKRRIQERREARRKERQLKRQQERKARVVKSREEQEKYDAFCRGVKEEYERLCRENPEGHFPEPSPPPPPARIIDEDYDGESEDDVSDSSSTLSVESEEGVDDTEVEEDMTLPPAIAGRKRRLSIESSDELVQTLFDNRALRPTKRLCSWGFNSTMPISNLRTAMPTPSPGPSSRFSSFSGRSSSCFSERSAASSCDRASTNALSDEEDVGSSRSLDDPDWRPSPLSSVQHTPAQSPSALPSYEVSPGPSTSDDDAGEPSTPTAPTSASPSIALPKTPDIPLSPDAASVSQRAIPVQYSTRKRRLSDADVQGVPKRSRCMSSLPRLQTVSDPLPKPQFNPYTQDWSSFFWPQDRQTMSPDSESSPSELEMINVRVFDWEPLGNFLPKLTHPVVPITADAFIQPGYMPNGREAKPLKPQLTGGSDSSNDSNDTDAPPATPENEPASLVQVHQVPSQLEAGPRDVASSENDVNAGVVTVLGEKQISWTVAQALSTEDIPTKCTSPADAVKSEDDVQAEMRALKAQQEAMARRIRELEAKCVESK